LRRLARPALPLGRSSDGFAVSCRRLSKSFDETIAVDAIDLEVADGEFLSLLGPSGCGKTTTLRMIAGLEAPTAGQVVVAGRDVTSTPPHKRPTNLVFQQGALFGHLSVFENVAFGLKAERMPRAEIRKRVTAMLAAVDLVGLEDRKPAQLSGGQAQRVAIARALVKEPAVLLLDEPLSALDLKLQIRMRAEIKRLHERLGTTFVCVTHNQAEALELSDRIAVMNQGRIEQIGSGPELYRQPRTRFVASFLGETNFLPGIVESTSGSSIVVAAGMRFSVPGDGHRNGARVLVSLRPETISLCEDIGQNPADSPPAIVTACRYLGSTVRYDVALADGTGILAEMPATGDLYRSGDKVRMEWMPSAAVLVPEDGAD
jgi:ABC-type Fe3+/spermidine/putrescine transport system ATPase subunit